MSGFRVKERRLAYQRVNKTALHCCVPLCTNSLRYNSSLSFHSFPVDVYARWMVRVQWDDLTPSKMSRVCSRHFKKEDFVDNLGKLRRLKKVAVPALFLGIIFKNHHQGRGCGSGDPEWKALVLSMTSTQREG